MEKYQNKIELKKNGGLQPIQISSLSPFPPPGPFEAPVSYPTCLGRMRYPAGLLHQQVFHKASFTLSSNKSARSISTHHSTSTGTMA